MSDDEIETFSRLARALDAWSAVNLNGADVTEVVLFGHGAANNLQRKTLL